jgi:hypothetical protein
MKTYLVHKCAEVLNDHRSLSGGEHERLVKFEVIVWSAGKVFVFIAREHALGSVLVRGEEVQSL